MSQVKSITLDVPKTSKCWEGRNIITCSSGKEVIEELVILRPCRGCMTMTQLIYELPTGTVDLMHDSTTIEQVKEALLLETTEYLQSAYSGTNTTALFTTVMDFWNIDPNLGFVRIAALMRLAAEDYKKPATEKTDLSIRFQNAMALDQISEPFKSMAMDVAVEGISRKQLLKILAEFGYNGNSDWFISNANLLSDIVERLNSFTQVGYLFDKDSLKLLIDKNFDNVYGTYTDNSSDLNRFIQEMAHRLASASQGGDTEASLIANLMSGM